MKAYPPIFGGVFLVNKFALNRPISITRLFGWSPMCR